MLLASCLPSPSTFFTHTHSRRHIHSQTHTHTLADTHTHARTHAYTHKHSPTHSQTYTHTLTLTQTQTLSLSLSLSLSHTHTHTHTHPPPHSSLAAWRFHVQLLVGQQTASHPQNENWKFITLPHGPWKGQNFGLQHRKSNGHCVSSERK